MLAVADKVDADEMRLDWGPGLMLAQRLVDLPPDAMRLQLQHVARVLIVIQIMLVPGALNFSFLGIFWEARGSRLA